MCIYFTSETVAKTSYLTSVYCSIVSKKIFFCFISPLDISQMSFNANTDQHASGVSANTVQSRALPQPEPLLQQPCFSSCLTMSIYLLTGQLTSLHLHLWTNTNEFVYSREFYSLYSLCFLSLPGCKK